MLRQPQNLTKGDTIAIVSPAKAIETALIQNAQKMLEEAGYCVIVGAHADGQHNYFSGTIQERLSDLQSAIDNPNVKAILCARGGYGCIQLVNKIDWSGFIQSPKWVIGFSDVTVFHQKIQSFGVESIHATMPLNFRDNSAESISSLLNAIQGGSYTIKAPGSSSNIAGESQGILVGGNLSILYSLKGSELSTIPENSILFIEDLAEQLYHIDRMFHAFENTGVLKRIKGLIVGGMTDLKDTEIPFGHSYEEIILEHCRSFGFPVAFNFPAGHINDNRALILGRNVELIASENESSLTF